MEERMSNPMASERKRILSQQKIVPKLDIDMMEDSQIVTVSETPSTIKIPTRSSESLTIKDTFEMSIRPDERGDTDKFIKKDEPEEEESVIEAGTTTNMPEKFEFKQPLISCIKDTFEEKFDFTVNLQETTKQPSMPHSVKIQRSTRDEEKNDWNKFANSVPAQFIKTNFHGNLLLLLL